MISVVVPIYKVERFLNKSIESLLNQTYKDFELILVDDGSPDNCPQICDDWEKKEPKIRVFHKKNEGLSSARNSGIEHASGEYIIFPDPDDWVEPDYLERLINLREEFKADLSICGHYHGTNIYDPEAELIVLTMEEALEKLMMPHSFCGYTWNKLYNLDIIKRNQLRFDVELGMVQDLHFNVRYFQYCEKIVYDPVPLYHHTIENGVTSRNTPLTTRKISGLLTYKKIADMTHGNYPNIERISYCSLCKMCLDYVDIYYKTKMNSKEILNLLQSNFVKYKKYFYNSKAFSVRFKRFSRLMVIHPRLYWYARRFYWRFLVPNKKKGTT
ncbi:MAG: glycosyltransferase [Lachnospiraceae bacterium]|nr:glycosyltransferase [Lachnospiraceae bacterium]